jgi:hypothetical protein
VIKQASGTNDHGEMGKISLSYDAELLSTVDYDGLIEIELVECGDFYPVFGVGLMSIEDTSNSYEVQIDVTYNMLTYET